MNGKQDRQSAADVYLAEFAQMTPEQQEAAFNFALAWVKRSLIRALNGMEPGAINPCQTN